MIKSRLLRLLLLAAMPSMVFCSTSAQADGPASAIAPATPLASPSLFNPARHMHVSEVKPGMTGYGLSVFQDSKIERFDVEVISILKNFNPKYDVVLIRCKGDYLNHTGSIAGMSGSPIFLKDEAGHDRMIGAFAYGWPLSKDPIAGVQPIEYMLDLPAPQKEETAAPSSPTTLPTAGATLLPGQIAPTHRATWSFPRASMLRFSRTAEQSTAPSRLSLADRSASHLLGEDVDTRLVPLATPLMTSGMSPSLFEQLAPQFRAAGLSPLQAGGGGAAAADPDIKLTPGSALAVPLVTGDMDMCAIGTVTEVIGDRIFGFGHPFNNEGPISLPMGSGIINGVIANLNTSFKLGSLAQLRGTLTTDGSVGVAGDIGAAPKMIPIEIDLFAADGTGKHTYHFQAVRHPKLTPMLIGAAFGAAVSGTSELPHYNTVDYDLQLSFANGQTVSLANRAVNSTGADLFGDATVVLQAAGDNPFQKVAITKVTGAVHVRPAVDSAQIIDINLPKSHYHPGDKVKAYVTYQPFRGDEAVLPVELDLPHDLPHGSYQLVISDAKRYFTDEQQSEPFRFTADNIGELFSVLKDVGGIRDNAIYLRLVRHPDGVAIGHTALPHLPSSRREILLGSGQSNTTPFISSTVKIVPTDLVMNGSSEFTIEVESASKSVVGSPRGAKPEPAEKARTDEPKKSLTPSESPGKKDSPKENGSG
jgi:hypothetical protein